MTTLGLSLSQDNHFPRGTVLETATPLLQLFVLFISSFFSFSALICPLWICCGVVYDEEGCRHAELREDTCFAVVEQDSRLAV